MIFYGQRQSKESIFGKQHILNLLQIVLHSYFVLVCCMLTFELDDPPHNAMKGKRKEKKSDALQTKTD